jgi:hypothetical protein
MSIDETQIDAENADQRWRKVHVKLPVIGATEG